MQPQQMPQPNFGGELPGHGMEPALPGQPTDMPPKQEMPNQPTYQPIMPDKNPAMPVQNPDTTNPYEKRGIIVPTVYDNQNFNIGQSSETEAPSPATAPAPPPPPPGGPNGPSDNGINPNDPNLSKYADNLNTANKDLDALKERVIQPLEVPNNNNLAPNDIKDIEDLNRRKEAFERDLENFKKSLTPDELEVYRKVFG